MEKYARQMEGILTKVPEAEGFFVVSGNPIVSQGISFARLKPWDDRERKQQEIVKSSGRR